MKKLLLFGVLAVSALAANAQQFVVTVDEKPVSNGQTVESYVVIKDVQEAFGMTFTQYQLRPEVCVAANENLPMTITVTNTSTEGNPNIQFCWPDNCQGIQPGTSLVREGGLYDNAPEGVNIGDPRDLAIDTPNFATMPEEGLTRTCHIKIASGSNVFEFNLNMVGDPNYDAHVSGLEADEVAPVYYNLNGVKVASPDHGIYIVKKGGKVSKMVL